MDVAQLLEILAQGEDSAHQYKRDVTNTDALAAELVALSNAAGGLLLIGVADSGSITGLTLADIGRLNQLLSNTASQNVKPPINPTTSNVNTAQGLVLVVSVSEGLNKPYMDGLGKIWVKNGADKRQVTAREEMQRMFQQAGLVYADEVPVSNATLVDIDAPGFGAYFERRYLQTLADAGQALPQLLENLKLATNSIPNLAALLLFGKQPQTLRPTFMVKAVAVAGTELYGTTYDDSEDIEGNLPAQYQRSLAFVRRNLHHVQGDQGVNSIGQLEIPEAVFEELLVNALVHRDYFISAPIKLLIFSDRVELISPGHLPNHLTIDQIRYGLSNMRNPLLVSHATHLLPYRGLGSGVPRALKAWPRITLDDDRMANQFKAVIWRADSSHYDH